MFLLFNLINILFTNSTFYKITFIQFKSLEMFYMMSVWVHPIQLVFLSMWCSTAGVPGQWATLRKRKSCVDITLFYLSPVFFQIRAFRQSLGCKRFLETFVLHLFRHVGDYGFGTSLKDQLPFDESSHRVGGGSWALLIHFHGDLCDISTASVVVVATEDILRMAWVLGEDGERFL